MSLTFLFLLHQDPFLICVYRPFFLGAVLGNGATGLIVLWHHPRLQLTDGAECVSKSLLILGMEDAPGFGLTEAVERELADSTRGTLLYPVRKGHAYVATFLEGDTYQLRQSLEVKCAASVVWMHKYNFFSWVMGTKEVPRDVDFSVLSLFISFPRSLLLSLPILKNSMPRM